MLDAIADRFPTTHTLEDGARVTLRLMSAEDRDALADFLSELPRLDLAYLQVDITRPEVQERWFDSIAEGKSICICAYDPRQLVGYASVQIESGSRAGEIRVNIRQGYRSRGLGRILINEIFAIARRLELKRLTARMLSDQYGARSAFEHLGFVREEVLKNHVKRRAGTSTDLLVMAAYADAASN